MNDLKVVYVGSFNPFQPVASGSAIYTLNLIKHMKNVEKTLVGIGPEKSKKYYDAEFISVCSAKKVSRIKFLALLWNAALNLKMSGDAGVTIIHAQRPDDLLPFVSFFKNTVCTLHGHYKYIQTYRKKAERAIYAYTERYVLKKASRLIAITTEIKNYYTARYAEIAKKILLIPPAVDTTVFKPFDKVKMRRKYNFDPADKIVLYVGRFEKEKRLSLLLRVVSTLKRSTPELKLVLVGDGSQLKSLKQIVSSLKLNEQVYFMPVLASNVVAEIMAASDAFALTSAYEGLPIVVLESLAVGLPVVAFDVGSLSTVIKNGATGYLVEKDNNEDFCNKLSVVLAESDRYKSTCVAVVENYSWQKVATRIRAVYNELAEIP